MDFFDVEFDDSFIGGGNWFKGHTMTPGKCKRIIKEISSYKGMDCAQMMGALGTKGKNACPSLSPNGLQVNVEQVMPSAEFKPSLNNGEFLRKK